MTPQMLVSVRNVPEALQAAAGGADFIDLKEPSQGALGGLPVPTIRAIVAALREAGRAQPVSATIGDWSMDELDAIAGRVQSVGATGVDIVKVGIVPDPAARAVLHRLAAMAGQGLRIVPVFIADQGVDQALADEALGLPFAGVMLDTQAKRNGSLFDRVERASLVRFVERARAAGRMVGLAGALRANDLPTLKELAPDFAGFRSAVCAGERSGALDPQRLHRLVAAMRG